MHCQFGCRLRGGKLLHDMLEAAVEAGDAAIRNAFELWFAKMLNWGKLVPSAVDDVWLSERTPGLTQLAAACRGLSFVGGA